MLTREELYQQYGDTKVELSSYYKHSFCFTNGPLSIFVGENGEDIYNLQVVASVKYTVRELEPRMAFFNSVCIFDDNI